MRDGAISQSLQAQDGPLGIRQFLIPPVVTALVDEFLCRCEVGPRADPCLRIFFLAEEEPGAVEVDVGHVKFHGPTLGNFPGFVQIRLRAPRADALAGETSQPSAGEESSDDKLLRTGAAEAVYGGVQFAMGGLRCLE
jgi:hypothetical protein